MGVEGGVYGARADEGHRHLIDRPLRPQAVGQSPQTRLGCAVGDLFGHSDQAGDGADEHELAPDAALAQVGGSGPGQVHGDPQVDVEQGVDLGPGHRLEEARPTGAGVGNDDVEPVQRRRGSFYDGLGCGRFE